MSIASCFVNKGRKIVSFELGEEMEKDSLFFFVPTRDKTKKKPSFFVSLPSSKQTIFLILFTKIVEIVRSRALFDWVSLNQNKTNHNGQSRKWLKWREANGNSELSKCLKRGKTQTTKSWLVFSEEFDWLRKWHVFSGPITALSRLKQNQNSPKSQTLKFDWVRYHAKDIFKSESASLTAPDNRQVVKSTEKLT